MAASTASGDWLSKINDAFDEIKNADESRKTVLGLINLHSLFFEMLQCSKIEIFCEEMVRLNYVTLAKRYISDVKSAVHHRLVFDILWNASDASREFCKSIIENKLHLIIIANLEDNAAFQLDNLNKKPKKEDLYHLLHAFLGVMNNTMHNYPESRSAISNTSLKYALKYLLDIEDLYVKSKVVLGLAYVADVASEEDQALISLRKSDLEFLVKHILPTTPHVRIENEYLQNTIPYEGICSNFSSEEILQPLAILATNPQTARELVKLGIVSACESALKKAHEKMFIARKACLPDNDSAKWALELLLRLTKNLLTSALIDFQDLIGQFKDNQKKEISRIATELVFTLKLVQQDESFALTSAVVSWNIDELSTPKLDGPKTETPTSNSSETEANDEVDCEKETNRGDYLTTAADLVSVSKSEDTDKNTIMISYCHKQKTVALKLLEELRQKEVGKIWIDVEHMHKSESILDEMADAVDGATYVICCISQDYHKSPNCMCEIEYARTQKKIIIPVVVEEDFTPQKSLLLCLGSKFRFDFSTDDQFESNFPLLLQKIKPREYGY